MSDATGSDPGCIALRWALALIDGLRAGGVETLVLSPGARSTPLVIAAARREATGHLRLVPILDERSAAFFALGVARASGRPVALLATSGSAPVHWHPAVIEADASGVPLLLLSADRPPRLRQWGANQTIDQARLFGPCVREFHDPGLPDLAPASLKAIGALGRRAAAQACGPRPGPVHLNLPFDEPLVPVGDCPELGSGLAADLDPVASLMPTAARPSDVVSFRSANPLPADAPARLPPGRGLIVCGPGAPSAGLSAAIWHAATRLALPVLVDPLSGLRTGPVADVTGIGCPRISGYDALLRHPAVARKLRPDWVLRLGRAPVSKTLGQWLAGLPTLLLDPTGGWSDPSHDVIARLCADPIALLAAWADAGPTAGQVAGSAAASARWLAAWVAAERRVAALAEAHLAAAPWGEGQIIRALRARIGPGEGLLCANSLPIRQLDTWWDASPSQTPIPSPTPSPTGVHLFGNRGASGIDGQVSTLAGLNAGGVPTWGLLGDLSLTHDLGGLLLAARLDRPLLVVNNGGGRIFDGLPQRTQPGFVRLWRTPVAPPLAALAATFGLEHRLVRDAAGLADVLAAPDRPGRMIELVIDAETSRASHLAFWQRVATDPELGAIVSAVDRA